MAKPGVKYGQKLPPRRHVARCFVDLPINPHYPLNDTEFRRSVAEALRGSPFFQRLIEPHGKLHVYHPRKLVSRLKKESRRPAPTRKIERETEEDVMA